MRIPSPSFGPEPQTRSWRASPVSPDGHLLPHPTDLHHEPLGQETSDSCQKWGLAVTAPLRKFISTYRQLAFRLLGREEPLPRPGRPALLYLVHTSTSRLAPRSEFTTVSSSRHSGRIHCTIAGPHFPGSDRGRTRR